MPSRIPRAPGLPFGLNLVLAAGAAYFVWEHGQDRHSRPHLLCPLCWLNKVAPDPETTAETTAETTPEPPA